MTDLLSVPHASRGDTDGSSQPIADTTGAIAYFEAWASAAASRKTKGLKEQSIQHYRSTWMNWIAWLPAGTTWMTASPQDVSKYLGQLTASARARQRAHNQTVRAASPVTRRRYWRVLRDIYSHAVIREEIPANPCTDVTDMPNSEIMRSMILQPNTIEIIRKGILKENQERKDSTWQELRDDALMLLLLETGAKTSELIALRTDQIWEVEQGGVKQHAVNLDGERKPQRRHFIIEDAKVNRVLAKWIYERRDVPFVPHSLFFGAKSTEINGLKQRSPLSKKTIFFIVSNVVAKYQGKAGLSGPLSHVGAETIRNSVLHSWLLQGASAEEVKELAGVKELRAIARLDPKQHTKP